MISLPTKLVPIEIHARKTERSLEYNRVICLIFHKIEPQTVFKKQLLASEDIVEQDLISQHSKALRFYTILSLWSRNSLR